MSGRSPVGGPGPPVRGVRARSYRFSMPAPESDGTLVWDETTLVVVEADAGDETGLGFGYTHPAAATLIQDRLAPIVEGRSARSPPAAWEAMRHEVRNLLRPGLVGAAIACVDVALWDLKARLSGMPLHHLLGALRDRVPAYGSGGFTSYDVDTLSSQLRGWVDEQGMTMVKMKVGREPDADVARVEAARRAVGEGVELFVDANGAYRRKQALAMGHGFREEARVSWFEEPVSSDDLSGLRLLRDRLPAGMAVAAGEYLTDLTAARRMLEAGAVDVLQLDAGRFGGFTPFLRGADLCEAHGVPLSAHTAPALHAAVCCAAPGVLHVEWFHDHALVEARVFDGGPTLEDGTLVPADALGLGLALKEADVEPYRVAA